MNRVEQLVHRIWRFERGHEGIETEISALKGLHQSLILRLLRSGASKELIRQINEHEQNYKELERVLSDSAYKLCQITAMKREIISILQKEVG